MALDDILKKIIDDAEAQAAAISKETEQKIKEITKQQAEKLSAHQKSYLTRSKSQAINHARSIVISATNDAKNKLLAKKKKLIQQIIDIALDKINKDKNLKEKLNNNLLVELKKSDLKNLTIVTNEHDKENLDRVTQKILSKNYSLKTRHIDNFKGGFYAISDKTTIDMTFKNLFDEKKSEIEKLLASKIF